MIPSRHYDGAVLIAPDCEEEYIREYRFDHPDERFVTFSYESLCELFEFDVIESKVEARHRILLPYLKRMTGSEYKSKSIQGYLPLVRRYLEEGTFHKKDDPARIFCGKPIIIRGYYAGKMIAEALQDLPNIALNWDLGRTRQKEEPCPTYSVHLLEEALGLIRQIPGITHVRYDDGDLPAGLPYRQIRGPFAPTMGKVAYIATRMTPMEEEAPFSDEALAELHLVGQEEARRRREFDERCFLHLENVLLKIEVRR